MHPAYQSLPRPSPPSPSRQNRVALQREYREREGECFNTLRDIIKDLTGDDLRTRQEILRKAIDILYTASEIRKQRGAQVGDLSAYQLLSPANHDSERMTSYSTDFSTQSSYFSHAWQPDAAGLNDTAHFRFHDQFYSMFDMDTPPNQASSQGRGQSQNWPNYHQP